MGWHRCRRGSTGSPYTRFVDWRRGARLRQAAGRAVTPSHGTRCLAISNTHDYPQPMSNNWAQALQEVPRSRTLALSAQVRAESADAANVCLQCWDEQNRLVAFASTPVFRGDQSWTRVKSQPVTVPQGTARVVVRAALTGKGNARFEDVTVQVVESQQKVQPSQEQPAALSELTELAGGGVVEGLPVTKDAMVLAYMENWAHGNLDNIGIGNNGGGVRLLVEWRQPEGEVKGKRFLLDLFAREATSPANDAAVGQAEKPKIRILPIHKEWDELISWTTQPPTPEEPAAEAAFDGRKGWKVFDVTPLVRAGARGALLRFEREDLPPGEGCSYQFVSREGDALRRPVLLVVQDKP